MRKQTVGWVHGSLCTLVVVMLVALAPGRAVAEVGIDEKLGETVPLELTFTDEDGQSVQLKDLVDRPTILTLVYYRCPGICGPLMGGVSEVLDRIIDQTPGEDFRVVTISFNAEETAEMARRKKDNYYKSFHSEMSQDAWRFLTGSQESIDAITAAVGFQYEPAGNEFVHPGAIMVLSKTGMVSRYLYGVTFLPFDVKMALMEAAQGRTGPTINKLLLYCFSYDPEGKTYVFNVLKVTGSVTMVFVLLFVAFLVISTRRHRRKEEAKSETKTENL